MFNSRAFGVIASLALIAGVVALTGSAAAAPLPLFSFPVQEPPQVVQPAPLDEPEATFELPVTVSAEDPNV